MSIFRNLRIAQKVLAGLGVLALLSVFVAGFGVYQLSSMAERSGTLISEQAESMKLAAQANENKSRMHQIWYATAIENDLPDFRKQLDEIASERRELKEKLDALRPFMRGNDAEHFATLEQGLAEYYAATDQVPPLWIAGRREEAEDVIQHPAREAFEKIDQALSAIVTSQDEALDAGAAAAEAQSTRALWTLIIVSLVGLVSICGAVVMMVGREVTGPIIAMTSLMNRLANGDHRMDVPNTERREEIGDMARAILVFRDNARAQAIAEDEKAQADAEQKLVVDTLAEGLRSVAGGDLTYEITANFTGRYADVKSSFNDAISSLRALIGTVIESAHSLQAGSQEIAQAAEDLARRTESNAASIEETTAALTQIDGRIKATAEAAVRTVSRADGAISSVSGGRSIADEAVQAMGRVRESAKGIDEVIEGVDKIAFQTRVLAMNAAVEAGRAGDAGRGFAVVADLVSALAMRAEEEAKRARDQLTLTQTDIVTAVGAVQSINGALTDISEGVGEVHALLDTMAHDNQAQATAITQISAAMSTMDQSTQQNAAMVEETSAAARNLSGEVQSLSDQANRFRIDGAGSAGKSRSSRTTDPALYLAASSGAAAPGWATA
ncbi:methyl-accepting chemotaxis protein [Novosphingobium sp. M1R2S20]|uniref:Methyl-accepting chemotaxis protein n=1 Tax=Novosphingobium rhizovicinum TaxID=3228928 RepID=A0ABV3RG60_9SPHN